MKNFSKKGFSLTELLVTIAVIGILSSVVLVNLSGAKQSARERAVFIDMVSTRPIVAKCIKSGITNAKLYATTTDTTGSPICVSDLALATPIPGFPNWSNLATKERWGVGSNILTYYCWANTNDYNSNTFPNSCLNFGISSCGYDSSTGRFCYFRKKEAGSPVVHGPFVYCTEQGCKWCKTGDDTAGDCKIL